MSMTVGEREDFTMIRCLRGCQAKDQGAYLSFIHSFA